MGMTLSVSAVICTHNRAGYLTKAIHSLVHQSMPRDKYEIIIVDNCSSDDTKEVVQQFREQANIRYVYESTLGLSYARNAGWRNAKGHYIAYLDDDAIACPDWLNKIVDVFETVIPRPGCVGGKVEPLWEAPRPKWLSAELVPGLTVIDWSDTPHVVTDLSRQWLVGANLAFPVEILERFGGFVSGLDRAGKKLLSSGDVFLEKQIAKAGYTCFYHPGMAVSHHIQKSRLKKAWFIRRYYWQGISDSVMQLLEEAPPRTERIRLAITKTWDLLRPPGKLINLVLPSDNPKHFTEKCFALIAVGHIAGLLGAARR
jgi:glycosyltransferase involved in cell wall biosynthesis